MKGEDREREAGCSELRGLTQHFMSSVRKQLCSFPIPTQYHEILFPVPFFILLQGPAVSLIYFEEQKSKEVSGSTDRETEV